MEYQTFVFTTRKGKNSIISLCFNGFQFRLYLHDSFGCEKHSFYKEAIKKT